MKIALFNVKPYERTAFDAANARYGHQLQYLDARLTMSTVALATGFPAICAFVNDSVNREVIAALASGGTKLIVLRSARFNPSISNNNMTLVR